MDVAPIRAVLFDKDGTLFDFPATWGAWTHAFLHRLVESDAQLQRIGKSLGYNIRQKRFSRGSVLVAGTPGQITDALLPHLPGRGRAEVLHMLNEEASSVPQVHATPLPALLKELRHRSLRLGVVTNDAEAPARVHLEKAGALGFLDFIAGFDSGYGAKPNPGQLTAFANAVGINPSQVLMVGDSLHDLQAAKAAGMPGLGVLTGMATREELAPHAVAVLPSIARLTDWLDCTAAES